MVSFILYCILNIDDFRGQFFEKHLKFIKLNDKFVNWTKKDLSYLLKVRCLHVYYIFVILFRIHCFVIKFIFKKHEFLAHLKDELLV